MRVKVSETLLIIATDWTNLKEVALVDKEFGVTLWLKFSELKELRQAIHAIETGDLSDEEKSGL